MKRKFLVSFSYYNIYGKTYIDSCSIEIEGPINQNVATDIISKRLDNNTQHLSTILGWSLIEE